MYGFVFQNLHELMRSEPETDKTKRNYVFNDEYQLMLNSPHQQQREEDGQCYLNETNLQNSRRSSRGTKRSIGDRSNDTNIVDNQFYDRQHQFDAKKMMPRTIGFQ